MMTINNETTGSEVEFQTLSISAKYPILKEIASAHVTTHYDWSQLKQIFTSILSSISSEVIASDGVMIKECVDIVQNLTQIPFTIQRICELLLMLENSTTQYSNFEKFSYALFKCLNVTGECEDVRLLPPVMQTKSLDKNIQIERSQMMDTS